MNTRRQISRFLDIVRKFGLSLFYILKIIFYDVTIILNRFPFGSWISILYFISIIYSIKSVVERGELYRAMKRAIHIYFIEQKSYNDCFTITQHYLWRTMMSQIYNFQSHTYTFIMYTWNSISTNVKKEVKQFAKDLILANADNIEQIVKDLAKNAISSAILITISKRLVSELYPILLDAFSKSDIHRNTEYSTPSCSDQFRITNQNNEIAKIIFAIVDTNSKCELHLIDNNSILTQKLEEISLQIKYLQSTQPLQFTEILNSLSTFASPSMTDVFAKLTDIIGSSASQQGRTRIDNR